MCIFYFVYYKSRLVIGTSRTVGSAKKFVRITSGFGGGEFTKTLCKICTCQKLKFSFLLLEYCKIRECYAVANAFTIRNMYSLFLYYLVFLLEEIGPDRAHCECMRRFASLLIVFCKIDKLTLLSTKQINTLIKINYSLSTFRRCPDSRERGKGD